MTQQSTSPTAYSWNVYCNCRHSQHAVYNYTLKYAMLLWPITVESLNTSRLHCLNYTTGFHTDTRRSLTQSQIHSLWLTALRWFPCWHSYAHWHSILTNCIELGWFTYIVPERSERTHRKHRLRHPFYCRVTSPRHHPGISLVRWRPPSREPSPTVAQSLLTSPALAPYIITSPVHAPTRRKFFHRTAASSG
jgi:hypothetical protein